MAPSLAQLYGPLQVPVPSKELLVLCSGVVQPAAAAGGGEGSFLSRANKGTNSRQKGAACASSVHVLAPPFQLNAEGGGWCRMQLLWSLTASQLGAAMAERPSAAIGLYRTGSARGNI